MSSFFWNVSGFNKPTKHSILRNWLQDQNIQFGGILETRVKEGKAPCILNSVFGEWSYMSNYEFNQGGRIWVLWRDSVRISPGFKSDQLITCSVLLQGEEEEFFCSFVYALNTVEGRKSLWEDLMDHQNAPLFHNKAWIIMGDFNEVLDGDEHSCFENTPSFSAGMRDFQEAANHCLLSDIGAYGPKFSWCNKRVEGLICKKLDRVLVNDKWLHGYGESYAVFEPGGCSDHLRCRVHIRKDQERIKRPFKYVNALSRLPDFLPLVKSYWEATAPLYHSTSALHRVSKKLKGLKAILRKLGKEKLGNLPKRAQLALETLCEKQGVSLSNPTEENMEEIEAYGHWSYVADLEEDFYKQQSKLHWLEVGDKSNKVFYNAMKIREAQNMIKEIQCVSGGVVSTQNEIKSEAVQFYSTFLNHKPPEYVETATSDLRELLNFRCKDEDCAMLGQEVTGEEIKRVVFAMAFHKSPGPDGYPCDFFKATWEILGSDFFIAIQSFFLKGFLPKGFNSTILALIPKRTDARMIKDYRPIACCNVIYKTISKLLASRLKKLLPSIISANQSAFVHGRMFMENVLLATELIKDYHSPTISPRAAMKIDISKAFDSVQWDFVLNTLLALGIPMKFVHWINLCITTPSFSVQVNGELAGYFQSKRGLRQGCSLSPCLFVLCMNVLSARMDKAAMDKCFGYHPLCRRLSLTHLCFSDDLLVFVEGNKRSIEGVISVFDGFAVESGLKISIEKSTIYMAGLSQSAKEQFLADFPFEPGALPVRYLGLPLLTKGMQKNDYLLLIERV